MLSDSNFFSADAVSIIAQPTRSTFLLPRPTFVEKSIVRLPDVHYAIEATIFPGLLLLAGFVVFVVQPRPPAASACWSSAAVLFVFGLGPSLKVAGNFVWKHGGTPVSWLPYRLLLAIPGLGALRAPVRVEYVLVAVLVAATVVALHASAHPLPRTRRGRRRSARGVLLATNLLVPVPTTTLRRHARERAGAARDRDARRVRATPS